MSALAQDLQRAANSIVEAVEQLAGRATDSRDGWRDSNAQHTVTQLSLGSIRQEMLDGFERLHRRLDAMGVPNG